MIISFPSQLVYFERKGYFAVLLPTISPDSLEYWLKYFNTSGLLGIYLYMTSDMLGIAFMSSLKVIQQFIFLFTRSYIRVIPQGTVDNNLGSDRLAGPKALDPNNYCRQPTLWLHNLCLEVLTEYGNVLRLFWAKAFPLLKLLMFRIWHSSSRYNFKRL